MIKRALQPLLWFCLLTSTLALASGLALSAASLTPPTALPHRPLGLTASGPPCHQPQGCLLWCCTVYITKFCAAITCSSP